MKVHPQHAFAVIKNGIISATDIYNHPPTLYRGETILEVMIIPLHQKPIPVKKKLYCYCGDPITGKRIKYCSDFCARHFNKKDLTLN